jgi:hypothetical protein
MSEGEDVTRGLTAVPVNSQVQETTFNPKTLTGAWTQLDRLNIPLNGDPNKLSREDLKEKLDLIRVQVGKVAGVAQNPDIKRQFTDLQTFVEEQQAKLVDPKTNHQDIIASMSSYGQEDTK